MIPVQHVDRRILPEQRRVVHAALAAVRGRAATIEAPRHLETELMHRFRDLHRSGRGWSSWLGGALQQMLMPTLAIGAVLIVCVFMAPWLLMTPPGTPLLGGEARTVSTPFYSLQTSDRLGTEQTGIIVPTEIPRATLADFGFPVDPQRIDEPVKAELLMARSGEVLAVRFIQQQGD